jgi:glutathione synthase/RimK-type ligase-like ATP-grasp enzyme
VRIAYVSAQLNAADPDPDLDWDLFEAACLDFDFEVEKVFWNDETVNWSDYRLAILRSPWDYTSQRDKFLSWAKSLTGQTTLINDFETIQANTDKRYLIELAKAVPTIETTFIYPNSLKNTDLESLLIKHKNLAIKPHIGAGAILAAKTDSLAGALNQISEIHHAQRIAMVQPYLTEVDTAGEIALVILGGEISHAVKKVPALTRGGHGDAQELVEVTKPLNEFVELISKNVENWHDLLYARIDVVPTAEGLLLMELELTEPTLFFPQFPAAANKLAQLISQRISGSK